MKNQNHPNVFGVVLAVAIVAASLLAGCGKLRSWYEARKQPANVHSVTLSWIASASSVEGYNVYRSTPPGAPTRLTVRLVPGTRYTDTTVEPGRTYSYYVTAVDFSAVESVPSEKITTTVPGSPAAQPQK
jgi:fibronectin type 3 domain-containing protein